MGLGLVELVLATEEHFGITIPDDDLPGTTTVGDLAALVVRLSEKRGGKSPPCRTSRAFYRLRRALVRAAGVERSRVTPSALVGELVPPFQRRRVWKAVRADGIVLPRLMVSRVLGTTILLGSVVVPVVLGIALSRPLLLLLPVPSFMVALVLLQPLRLALPPGCRTVGDLAESVSHQAPIVGPLSPDEVEAAVRSLVAEHLDVPLEKVTPNARFIEDLGGG